MPTLFLLLFTVLVPLVVANPISTNVESANSGQEDANVCADGQCLPLYSCEWDDLKVPCHVNLTSTEVVDASTSLVIGYLDDTSTSADEASLPNRPNGPNPQARAVGKKNEPETSTSTAPQNQLEKRGHDYALNCGDGNGPRYQLCSGAPYRYYCKKNGGLDNSGPFYHLCDVWCNCQLIYFKYCPVAGNLVLCGVSPLGPADSTDTTGNLTETTVLSNGSIFSEDGSGNPRKRGVSNSPEREVEPAVLEPAADLKVLTKRHNYALDCTSATEAHQVECKDFGYYCTSDGAVQALYGRYAPCDAACECRILYANCVVSRGDIITCVGVHGKSVVKAENEVPAVFIAQIVNGTSVLLDNGMVLNDVQWD